MEDMTPYQKATIERIHELNCILCHPWKEKLPDEFIERIHQRLHELSEGADLPDKLWLVPYLTEKD